MSEKNRTDLEYLKFDTEGRIRVASYLLDDAGAVFGFKLVDGKPRVSCMPYLYDIAEGNISDHKSFSKYGVVSGVNNTLVDVWEYGSTTALYVFPTSAAKMRVVSSNSNDTIAGSGAQKIKIEGLIAGYVETFETISMNGTGVVETVNSFLRINKVYVSQGAAAAGQINVYHLTNATPIYAIISAGYTQSRQLIYTVPTGKNLYITSVRVSSGAGGNAIKLNFCRFINRATVDPITGAVGTIFYPFNEIGVMNQAFMLPLEIPTKIPATADLKISVIGDYASGASNCTAAIRGWLETA